MESTDIDIYITLSYWLFALTCSSIACVYQMHQLVFSNRYKFLGREIDEFSIIDIPIAIIVGFATGSLFFVVSPVLIPSIVFFLIFELIVCDLNKFRLYLNKIEI